MATPRTKSISAKVTEAEYGRLVALAGERTLSEWLRTLALDALAATRPESRESIVLAELLALRTIVLNLSFAASRGEPLSADAMQRLIARADQDKVSQAQERLTAMTLRRDP